MFAEDVQCETNKIELLFIDETFPGVFSNFIDFLLERNNQKTDYGSVVDYNITFVSEKVHPYSSYCGVTIISPEEHREMSFEESQKNIFGMLLQLKFQSKSNPNIIFVNSKNGMYVVNVYPNIPIIGYFDKYYPAIASDVTELIEFGVRNKFADYLTKYCSICLTGSRLQRNLYPIEMRTKILVKNSGINTKFFSGFDNQERSAKNILYIVDDVRDNYFDVFLQIVKKMESYNFFVLTKNSCNIENIENISNIEIFYDLSDDNRKKMYTNTTLLLYLNRGVLVSKNLLEAICCQTPILTSSDLSTCEFIGDYKNTFSISEIKTIEDLVDLIEKQIDNSNSQNFKQELSSLQQKIIQQYDRESYNNFINDVMMKLID